MQKENSEILAKRSAQPTPWSNGKYVLDKASGEYRYLLCKRLFKFWGTGPH